METDGKDCGAHGDCPQKVRDNGEYKGYKDYGNDESCGDCLTRGYLNYLGSLKDRDCGDGRDCGGGRYGDWGAYGDHGDHKSLGNCKDYGDCPELLKVRDWKDCGYLGDCIQLVAVSIYSW